MLGKLKLWGIGLLSGLLLLFYTLFKAEKAKRTREKLQRVKAARETERKATEAMVEGQKREKRGVQNARDKAKSGRRDHFES